MHLHCAALNPQNASCFRQTRNVERTKCHSFQLIELSKPTVVAAAAAPTPSPPSFHTLSLSLQLLARRELRRKKQKESKEEHPLAKVHRKTGSLESYQNPHKKSQEMSQAEKMQGQEHEEEQSSDLEVSRN